MSNKYQTKVFKTQRSLTDYQKGERSTLAKLAIATAIVGGIALFIVGLGIAGNYEVHDYQVANGLEAGK